MTKQPQFKYSFDQPIGVLAKGIFKLGLYMGFAHACLAQRANAFQASRHQPPTRGSSSQ